MAIPLIRSGYDAKIMVRVRVDGTNENLTGATVEASLVDATKTTELIVDTAQSSGTTGADWASGLVAVVFNAAATTALVAADVAYIELGITLSGTRLPCDSVPVRIEKGWTL